MTRQNEINENRPWVHTEQRSRQLRVFIISTKEVMFSSVFVCLFVCLLATLRKNFQTDLHEIFSEGWQWASEQTVKFWCRSGSGIRIRIRIRIRIATLIRRALAKVCTVPVLLVLPTTVMLTTSVLGWCVSDSITLKWWRRFMHGWSDVTVIYGHITNSVLWSNTAYCVKLSGEDLLRYSNKIESAGGLRWCPYYHYLTNKVMSQ